MGYSRMLSLPTMNFRRLAATLVVALVASLGQMRFLGSRFVVGEGD